MVGWMIDRLIDERLVRSNDKGMMRVVVDRSNSRSKKEERQGGGGGGGTRDK